MALFQLTLPRTSFAARTLKNRVDCLLMAAADATAAKATAAAMYGDIWLESTSVTPSGTSAAKWDDWMVTVQVEGMPGVAATAAAESSDLNGVGAALAIALNALDGIAGAAYSSPTLTIAETTDALGDKDVIVKLINPKGQDMSVLLGTITSQGEKNDALKVVLPAGAPAGIITKSTLR